MRQRASVRFSGVLLLIPMLLFFNLWSNWGATLYGEVRGASDFRKNIYAMGGALIGTTIVAVIFFLLFSKTFGWTFYMGSSSAYLGRDDPDRGVPISGDAGGDGLQSPVLQFILIAIMSLWFFGWVGSVFLSSTRVVFAASFDRILPEKVVERLQERRAYWALALMLLPSIPLAALYAWSSSFASYTLDATLVIAITFLGTTVSAAILPWRKPEIYNASPIAKYRVLGLPIITSAALLFAALLIWALIKWFTDDAYGVNNTDSYILMGGMYVLAIAIYVVSQIVRKRQGIDLGMVYGEIPAE